MCTCILVDTYVLLTKQTIENMFLIIHVLGKCTRLNIRIYRRLVIRHVHGSKMTQILDPYSGNGSGDTALINAARYGA